MGIPKLSSWVGSTERVGCEGSSEISLTVEPSLVKLWCRIEVKFIEALEQSSALAGGGSCLWELSRQSGEAREPCIETPVQEAFSPGSSSRMSHSLGLSTSVFGKLQALGGSKDCMVFTAGWEGKGGLHSLWTALTGGQEWCLLIGLSGSSCVIARGGFPLLRLYFIFSSNKLVLSKVGFWTVTALKLLWGAG